MKTDIKTFHTTAKRNTWIAILMLVLGIIWIFYFIIEHKYLDLIAGIVTILCALWFALLIIKCRHTAVTIGPKGIQMDECASLIRNGRITKPQTRTIGWEQIVEVGKKSFTLHTGEQFVVWDSYLYLNTFSKKYSKFTTSSAINDDAWKEIERYYKMYKIKTQE